jgi:hypothetical protein
MTLYGTIRTNTNIYMRACERLEPYTLVRIMLRPLYGVKAVTHRKHAIFGATITGAKAGQGIWVTQSGPMAVRMK